MFGSGILDTVIGLTFIFFMVSSLVTIINEMIAAALRSRAKWLRFGITRLLNSDLMARIYDHPLIDGTARKSQGGVIEQGPSYIASRTFANVLLNVVEKDSPEIAQIRVKLQGIQKALETNQTTVQDLNTQLSGLKGEGHIWPLVAGDLARHLNTAKRKRRLHEPYTVADAVHDIQRFMDAMPARYLRQMVESIPDENLKKTLGTLLDDAGHDIDKLKENIEIWFNSSMDRVSGWYKRRTQWVTAFLALVLSVGMNVDAIVLFRHLQTYPAESQAIVGQATEYVKNYSQSGQSSTEPLELTQQYEKTRTQLTSMQLPMGWDFNVIFDKRTFGENLSRFWHSLFSHLPGWLLTALAATLGAPFWFDILNRLISIRATGKAPEEKPKPPKAVSVPVEPGQSPKEADRLN